MKSINNIGADFEVIAQQVILKEKGIVVTKNIGIAIGIDKIKKIHRFDLGNTEHKILVECKNHAWTATGNSPSAKMTIWNEAMLYFSLVTENYKNILFVNKSIHDLKKESLAHYYFRTYSHLIPANVEIWEYDVISKDVKIHKN